MGIIWREKKGFFQPVSFGFICGHYNLFYIKTVEVCGISRFTELNQFVCVCAKLIPAGQRRRH